MIFLAFATIWPPSTFQSIVFMSATNLFDFSTTTCGLIIGPINTWDTTYYVPSATTPTIITSATLVTSIATLVSVVGANYPGS